MNNWSPALLSGWEINIAQQVMMRLWHRPDRGDGMSRDLICFFHCCIFIKGF